MARGQSGRRMRRGRDEVARIIADYEGSGLAQREFAARRGIALGTLMGWLRRLRRDRFIEVRNDAVGAAGAAAGFAVDLAAGMRIEVPRGFAPEELGALLAELRGAGCLP